MLYLFLAIWMLAYWGLSYLAGPLTCRDGWHSSSIGTRGACSWHGGVSDGAQVFLAVLSFAVACTACIAIARWDQRRHNR
jgi:hypothetical protein